MLYSTFYNQKADQLSNLWRYVPTDESMWMNYEHDHLIDAYTEDGRLHILTRYDEEMSREYCENTVGVQYEGEIYTTDTICDENNYDLLAFVVRKELNGSSEVVNTILFEYDGELDRFIDFIIHGGEITDDMAAAAAGGGGYIPSQDVHRLLSHFKMMRSK